MFMRFVTTRINKKSQKPEGVFAAAYYLLDSAALDSNEWERLRDLLIWFNKNLPHPSARFSAKRAILWFKSSAEESMRPIWELVHFLRLHGYHVEVHKCRHLANISYEDRYQVAAYPSEQDRKTAVQ
jgi:hypothetical protein